MDSGVRNCTGCGVAEGETHKELSSAYKWALRELELARQRDANREVELGVIEFHSSSVNPGLIDRFYAVRDDLIAAGCIVDLWLMHIATVLGEFGYEMTVRRTPEKQAQHEARQAERKAR